MKFFDGPTMIAEYPRESEAKPVGSIRFDFTIKSDYTPIVFFNGRKYYSKNGRLYPVECSCD